MYLKALELQGFKSFADQTKFQFGEGISAVVGPNGSGKSNVVEAIQWVLGEQSAKSLRGHKMPDLIFNGTKKRRPLGLAEISIVLDNSDHALDIEYNEVRVTRRLYRSGEGEYLINGNNVRLKDIHRLFADSGIGLDSYAVIGQGRIAEIIDSRPEDRRSIIEETAGVVKYRERKKEALRKITAAESNLDRLNDIITEIESRLGPLERDSVNAAKYMEYASERDNLNIGMLGETYEDTNTRLADLDKELSAATGERDRLTAAYASAEAKLDALKQQLATESDLHHEEEQKYHSLELEISEEEGNLQVLENSLNTLENKIAGLKDEIGDAKEKNTGLEQSLAEAAELKDTKNKELAQIKARLDEMESVRAEESGDLVKAEGELEELRASAFEMVREAGNSKNRRTALEQQRSGDKHRLENVIIKRNQGFEEQELLRVRAGEIADALDDLADEKHNLSLKRREFLTEGEALDNREQECNAGLVEEKLAYSRKETRLKTLEELALKREGFYPGVRAVLENKSQVTEGEIYGVVAELIHADKKIDLAVEAVLGNALQNIVTDTGETAASAIDWLKQNRKGQATFLPLDLLNVKERKKLPPDILKEKAYLGVAADMVSCSRSMQQIVEYLLGGTLIFEEIKSAVAVARRHKGQFRIVTLEGDVIQPGGSISGGSRDKDKNTFLRRQNEIEDIRRQLISGEKAIDSLTAELNQIKDDRSRLQLSLKEYDDKQAKLEEREQSYDKEIHALDVKSEACENNLAELEEEITKLQEDISLTEQTIADLNEEIARASREEESLMAEITEKEELLKAAKEEQLKGQDEYTGLQVDYTAAKSAYDHSHIEWRRIGQELEEGKAELEQKETQLAEDGEKLKEGRLERDELNEFIMSKNKELLEFSSGLQDRSGVTEELKREIEEGEKNRRRLGNEESDQKEAVFKLSLRKERLEAEVSQCVEQLMEDYKMIPADALPYIDRERTKKDKRERIKILNRQIEALGTVNPGAIEEFKEVSERYEFLTSQRNDVTEARDSLIKVVEDMDDIIGRRFKETFKAVDESFRETFPAFFRGGHGELRLTDEDNMLETGIDIVVQPPGKKLQHLSLLSGGEKSLSGIALLFAILKVKPSPFYVLDEIDAALDDANVKRFGDYLTEYGVNSQFLVITHRQGTMEAAETMYGVTMAEEGISRIVSVKLA